MSIYLLNRIKGQNTKSLVEQFSENSKNVIHANPLWRGEIIPHYPIYKNYFVLVKYQVNMESAMKDLKFAMDNQEWINKDGENWTSITLKSLNGLDQDFLVETDLGVGRDNKYIYTSVMDRCKYFKYIFDMLNTDIYLVRILKLKAGGKIKFHTDEIVFKKRKEIIRCHIPIITNPNVKFQIGYPKMRPAPGFHIWDADVFHEKYLYPGYIWYTNVNTLHGVTNNSSEDRYHLVIDLRPTPSMLKAIYGKN